MTAVPASIFMCYSISITVLKGQVTFAFHYCRVFFELYLIYCITGFIYHYYRTMKTKKSSRWQFENRNI